MINISQDFDRKDLEYDLCFSSYNEGYHFIFVLSDYFDLSIYYFIFYFYFSKKFRIFHNFCQIFILKLIFLNKGLHLNQPPDKHDGQFARLTSKLEGRNIDRQTDKQLSYTETDRQGRHDGQFA